MACAAVATAPGDISPGSPMSCRAEGTAAAAQPLNLLAAVRDLGQKAGERLEEWLWWLDQPVNFPAWLEGKATSAPSEAKCTTTPADGKKLGPPPFLVSLPPEDASELLAACLAPSGQTPPQSTPPSPSSAASEESLSELEGLSRPRIVSVIAPGAGIGANGGVYARLGSGKQFEVRVVGRARDAYDRYPEGWPQGCPAPNLQSFGQEILARKLAAGSDCLVLGSRGGQVVLPLLWQALGDEAPPALVINGGCALSSPSPVSWPRRAVTFLVLGGQDYFRGGMSPEDFVASARRCVPAGNETTAILYVSEMEHMPQAQLLDVLMDRALEALLSWKASGSPPADDFSSLLSELARGGWSGRLLHTTGQRCWQDIAFAPARAGARRHTEPAAR